MVTRVTKSRRLGASPRDGLVAKIVCAPAKAACVASKAEGGAMWLHGLQVAAGVCLGIGMNRGVRLAFAWAYARA